MQFDAVLIAPRRAAMLAASLWPDRTINDALDDCLAQCPDKPALIAMRTEDSSVTRMSYRELAAMADRIGVGLHRLGVQAGDVVAVQLPNWWQFTAVYLACSRIGAVMNPLMHIFRERELAFMLAHSEAGVFICPKVFRGFDHEEMALRLREKLPHLKHAVAVDGSSDKNFEALLSGPAWEQEADAQAVLTEHRPGPDDVTQLIYTSGTTGEPKGAMHTANTLFSNILPYAERLNLKNTDVVLMASPMAHQTGFMYGLMMPVILRATAVLLDVWEPRKAIDLIRAEGCSFTMASTPFLTDLARNVADSGVGVPSLKTFLCAGAPIPGPLVEQAHAVLDATIISAWGMTENGAVTTTLPRDLPERSVNTDGVALPGVEIRIADFDGADMPLGESGRLLLRACSNFGGYLKRPQFNNTDTDGWFDTGDVARLDAQGYIRITGRSKDVIIRGGENIPVVEIEALLYKHPAVQQVAIVAFPDERLGERACAVIVPKPSQTLDLPAVVAFLREQKVATNYMPEKVVIRDAMPTTPSGKIQKFKLREELKEQLA